MRRPFLIPSILSAFLCLISPAHGEMQLTLGGEFSTGTYGSDREIRTLTLPVSLAWYGERFDLRVEGSFIRQSDPSVTTILYGGFAPNVQVARWGSPGGPGRGAPPRPDHHREGERLRRRGASRALATRSSEEGRSLRHRPIGAVTSGDHSS